MRALIIFKLDCSGLHQQLKKVICLAKSVPNIQIDVLFLGLVGQKLEEQVNQTNFVENIYIQTQSQNSFLNPFTVANSLADFVGDYQYILADNSQFSQILLTTLASLFDCENISNLVKIVFNNCFERTAYYSTIVETVQYQNSKYFCNINTKSVVLPEDTESGEHCEITQSYIIVNNDNYNYIQTRQISSDIKERANILCVGSAVHSGAFFQKCLVIADRLKLLPVASSGSVDKKIADTTFAIKSEIAPNLYLAIGVAGSYQHFDKIKNAKTIIAIIPNKYVNFYQMADFVLICDTKQAVDKLCEMLEVGQGGKNLT
jgi:electron transfer flavoprotein alpha subunit